MTPRRMIDKAVAKLQQSISRRENSRLQLEGRAEEKRRAMREFAKQLRRNSGKEEELSRTKIDLKTVELAIKDLTVRCCVV